MKSVLTLGTFDGVHLGHQRILQRMLRIARRKKRRAVVLSFVMPPRHAHLPDAVPVLLTTADEKNRLLKVAGMDRVVPLIFDRKTSQTPAQLFFDRQMIARWNADVLVVGPDVAFGYRRSGSLSFLRRACRRAGIELVVVSPVRLGRRKISSSLIREKLRAADLASARQMLGRPYEAKGGVVRGDGRGRKMGFPTVNVRIPAGKILPAGVSIVRAFLGRGRFLRGLCNVGNRPTFYGRNGERTVEIYFPGRQISRSLNGRRIRIVFDRYLRPERRFSTVASLILQLQRDVRSFQRINRR